MAACSGPPTRVGWRGETRADQARRLRGARDDRPRARRRRRLISARTHRRGDGDPAALPAAGDGRPRARRRSSRASRGGAAATGSSVPAADDSLLTIVEAVEGDSRRETCVLRGGPCGRDGACAVHAAFCAAEEAHDRRARVRDARRGQPTAARPGACAADLTAAAPARRRRPRRRRRADPARREGPGLAARPLRSARGLERRPAPVVSPAHAFQTAMSPTLMSLVASTGPIFCGR